MAKKLTEILQQFRSYAQDTADKFENLEAEQQINQSFTQVEGSLASFLTLVPDNVSTANNHGDFSAQVQGVLDLLGDSLRNSLGGFKRGADICSFEGIADAFRNK